MTKFIVGTLSALFTILTGVAQAGSLPQAHGTSGIRMGEGTVEGFVDFLVPIGESKNSTLFLNPRFSIKDEGENEANFGLVFRHLMPNRNVVLGGNVFLDTRRTEFDNRFNQVGVGLEVLSKWVDARVNWYDADSDRELINELSTREIDVSTDVRTTVSSISTQSVGVQFDNPFASGHSILQDVTTTTTTTTTNTFRTTRTTTTTTTDRLFQQFESGLDGYDAEIGFLLPLSDSAPEVRLFGGVYDFDGEFGEEVKGFKSRLEVRAGPFLTFDAEVYEDDALNGTDYFIGARLLIPLHGRDTFKRFKKAFRLSAKRPFKERKYTDMVIRDVRVQTRESDFIEDETQMQQEVDIDREITQTQNVDTQTTQTESRESISSNNFFIDEDNAASATQDGTISDPFATIEAALVAAGEGGTAFLCNVGGTICGAGGSDGTGEYDNAGIELLEGQTLTSEIQALGGMSFTTGGTPTIRPTTNPGGAEAIILMSDNTTLNRINVDSTGVTNINGVSAPAGSNGRSLAILNSVFTTDDAMETGILIDNSGVRNSQTTIIGTTITTTGNDADAININNASGHNAQYLFSGKQYQLGRRWHFYLQRRYQWRLYRDTGQHDCQPGRRCHTN